MNLKENILKNSGVINEGFEERDAELKNLRLEYKHGNNKIAEDREKQIQELKRKYLTYVTNKFKKDVLNGDKDSKDKFTTSILHVIQRLEWELEVIKGKRSYQHMHQEEF